ncbi:hypothetical protein ALP01_200362 [Pseudomonas caricapapayae]|nr:hypothetical protein ALP01_200362 [Pseudomonas caricapapayae]
MLQLHLAKRWMPTPYLPPFTRHLHISLCTTCLASANFVGSLGEAVSHHSQVL